MAPGPALVWLAPLLATLLLQILNAFLTRLIPFLAPILTTEAGLSPTAVGHLSAVNTAGSILFLIAGAPLLRGLGPLRTMQFGALAGGAGALLIGWPTGATLLLASLLTGLGYGPSPAAGGEILQRHAPPRHRALIFSIKQAGVPVGGVLGGILLPWLAASDWRHALLVSSAFAIIAVLAVQPARARIDAGRDPDLRLSPGIFLSAHNLTAPLRALKQSPGVPRLTAAAFCFASAQGVLFAFFTTYLVVDLGFSLGAAGALFALNQMASVFGRVGLGWIVDRTGAAAMTLTLLSVASAATTAAIALISPAWPSIAITALALVSGVTVVSWNGVVLSETARRAPPHLVAEASAGSTLLIFMGYVIAPAVFALVVEASQSYRLGFALMACVALGAAGFLAPLVERSKHW